jgi:Fe2+ transport system protein FeoA
MASYRDVFQRAALYIDVAATTGNVQMFNYMSYVIGKPSDHPEAYTKALISSSEAGQIDMVRALLSMGAIDDSECNAHHAAILSGNLNIATLVLH